MGIVGNYNHIHLLSPDPDAAAEWYVKFLDGEIAAKGELRGFYNVRLRVGDANLYIRGKAKTDVIAEGDGVRRWGIDHFCFVVEGIDQMLHRVEDRGGKIAEPAFSLPNGNRGAYIEGPDGVLIELLEMKPN